MYCTVHSCTMFTTVHQHKTRNNDAAAKSIVGQTAEMKNKLEFLRYGYRVHYLPHSNW